MRRQAKIRNLERMQLLKNFAADSKKEDADFRRGMTALLQPMNAFAYMLLSVPAFRGEMECSVAPASNSDILIDSGLRKNQLDEEEKKLVIFHWASSL